MEKKKMKVIDLLNKIANEEEVPKKIRITYYNFFYDEDDQEYKDDKLFPLGARLILDRVLNKKVEIIDDTPKVQVEMTQEEYMEYLDNKLDTPKKIKRLNEKKATDKIFTYENGSNLYFLSLYVQHNIVDKINEIIDRINEE